MTSWKPCPAPKEGDVVRWKEPLWAEPTKKRGLRDEVGVQGVVAKIVELGETVQLEVEEAQIISFTTEAEPALKIKPGDIIRRKLTSIERGGCEKRH